MIKDGADLREYESVEEEKNTMILRVTAHSNGTVCRSGH